VVEVVVVNRVVVVVLMMMTLSGDQEPFVQMYCVDDHH